MTHWFLIAANSLVVMILVGILPAMIKRKEADTAVANCVAIALFAANIYTLWGDA